MYHEALALIDELLSELKRLDDKNVLMEVQLLESRVCHALRNFPKSRVWLLNIYININIYIIYSCIFSHICILIFY